MSGRKTYPSPDVQWDRTVDFYLHHSEYHWDDLQCRLGDDWHIGRIVQPHRLFVPGDVVIIQCWNGGGERQHVVAVSSKGYAVDGIYLKYRTCYRRGVQLHGEAAARVKRLNEDLGGHPDKQVSHSKFIEVDRGPLRFVEHPGDLAGCRPDDPAVRRYVVEALRAGHAASG